MRRIFLLTLLFTLNITVLFGQYTKTDITVIKNSIETYRDIARTDHKSADNYNNWGNALLDLYKAENDEKLLEESIAKFYIASSLDSKNAIIYSNLSNAWFEVAENYVDENFYQTSYDYYLKAKTLNANNTNKYCIWGDPGITIRKIKEDKGLTKDSGAFVAAYVWILASNQKNIILWKVAVEKIEQAIKNNPKDVHSHSLLAGALSQIAANDMSEKNVRATIKACNEGLLLNSPQYNHIFVGIKEPMESILSTINESPQFFEDSDKKTIISSLINSMEILSIVDKAETENNLDLFYESLKDAQLYIDQNPKDPAGYCIAGVIQAKIAERTDKLHLYKEACDNFEKFEIYNTDNASELAKLTYKAWSTTLSVYGKKSNNNKLLKQSLPIYDKAIKIDKEDKDVLLNQTYTLHILAEKEQSEKYYKECIEAYKKIGNLYPEDIDILNNWSAAIIELANIKGSFYGYKTSLESILKKAEQIKPGSGSYNLVCLYAMTKDNTKALVWFEKALKLGDTSRKHIESDTDLDNIRHEPKFKELLDKYRPE